VLKSGKCLYCGAPIPGALHVVETQGGLPPELQLALQAGAEKSAGGSRWIRRMIAFGVAAILVAAIMGPCMNS
jgi:hypothetical protein